MTLKLVSASPCFHGVQAATKLKNTTATKYMMTQMVRHGIRYQDAESMKQLEAVAALEIEYTELEAEIEPLGIAVRTRFQNEVKYKDRFRLNAEPLLLRGHEQKCPLAKTLEEFCMCNGRL